MSDLTLEAIKDRPVGFYPPAEPFVALHPDERDALVTEVKQLRAALDRARDACACCGDPIDRTGIPDHHHVTYCTDCLAASCSEYPGECGKVPRSKVEIAKVKGLVPITREEQSAVDRIADPGREMTDEILSDEAELARTREALRHVREGDVVPWTRPSDPGLPDPSGPVA